MSRRNYFEDLEYEIANGMDSTTPLASMRPGFVRTAYNCNLGLISGYEKRQGYSEFLTVAWGVLDITQGLEFTDSTATTRLMVYGLGATGELSYIDFGATTVTSPSLLTGLSAAARPSLINFGKLNFFFNGVDVPKVWGGTGAVRQVGITAPVAGPVGTAANTGGSLVASGRYLGAYTYYNSATGAESTPSPLTSVTLGGGDNRINWTFSAGDSATADYIRIYLTVAGGNELFYDGAVAIGVTAYTSNQLASALGQAMELDNTRIEDLSATAKCPFVSQNRLFLITGDNEVRWSKVGQSGPMPESFEVQAVSSTMGSRGSNDKAIGGAAIGEVPIILKESSYGRLEAIGYQDPTSAYDGQFFVYKEISNEVGGVSHFASAQVEKELLFLSRNNIYATDGLNHRSVADSIQATIRALGYSSTQVSRVSAVNDSKYKRVYFSVFNTSVATKPTYILVGDYQRYPDFRWSIYRPGTNTTTHPGIKPGCFIQVRKSDGTKDIYFGNVDVNGQLYKMNTGTSDNTKGINFEISSRPYNGQGRINFVKLFKDINIQVRGDGSDYDLTVATLYDLSIQEENSQDLSLYNGGSLFDTALFDVDTFATDESVNVEYCAHRKAKFQQIVIRQTDADAPITVQGWSTSGSVFGPF